MKFERQRVSFMSRGITCGGYLFTPPRQTTARLPCVVMANGFSGTMDWILPDFAKAFASSGFATLIFDYRHLGESEGIPRQLIEPSEQLTDLRNAIAFVKRQNIVDPNRIALWGTSLGGSHVVRIAAEDQTISAVIGNMPAIDAIKGSNVKAKMKKTGGTNIQLVTASVKLLVAGVVDTVRGWLGFNPCYLKVFGKPGKAFFADPALAARFENLKKNSPTWRNKVAARFLFKAPRYKEGTFEKIKAPILLTLATDDVEVSIDYIKEKARNARSVEIKEYPSSHFDLYHGEVLTSVIEDQLAFLNKKLMPSPRQSVETA
jgi:dienelactone hydrolase